MLIEAEDNPFVEDDGSALPVFTDHLETDMAEQLAFRTFFVFSAEEMLLPLQNVKLGAPTIWPVSEDELCTIASDIGREVMNSANLPELGRFQC